jgi:N-acetylglucosamine-6-phosphate deacetylase
MKGLGVKRLLIKNARVVSPGVGICPGALLIEDGKIANIHPLSSAVDLTDVETLDAADRLLTPGLIDMHTHGVRHFLYDNGPDDLRQALQCVPAYGCTCTVPTLVATGSPDMLERIGTLADALQETPGATAPGLHLEGPFMAETGAACKRMAGDTVLLDELIAACQGRLAIMSISPETANIIPVIEHLNEAGVVPFMTHTRADVEQTEAAIAAGARHATHFYDVFYPLEETDEGVRPVACVEAILADRDVSVDFICDGVHVHPAAIRMSLWAKGFEQMMLITDSSMGAGLPAGEYDTPWGFRITVVPGKGARIIGPHEHAGALAGSSLTMNQGVANLLDWLDIPPEQVWAMATSNPARVLGLQTKGTVEVGTDADLVLWNDDLTPRRTWVGGECVFQDESNTDERVDR